MDEEIEIPIIEKKLTDHSSGESETLTAVNTPNEKSYEHENRKNFDCSFSADEKSIYTKGDIEKTEKILGDNVDGENSPIPMVAAAVSTKDDPTLPCMTFRFWILSTEHVCIAVATGAGGGSAYATVIKKLSKSKIIEDIIAIQELFYNQEVNFVKGILLLISTQMLGYGLAGFLRKYLVRPANMIWPSNLVFASMYSTLHGNAEETREKLRFFMIAFSFIFVWQFVPQYMFTWLTSMAVLCLLSPANSTMKKLGSGYHGVGILDFTLDWNAIGQSGPLFTPWFASANWYFGVIAGAWVIAPLLYFNDVLNAKKFPFLATYSLDKNGQRYNQTAVIDSNTGTLNLTAYEELGPVYLSVTFAAGYFWSFIAFAAAISHVLLFYGDEIWQRFKSSRSEEGEDIHSKLMRRYPEIPNWWYGIIFVGMLCIAITLGYVTEANLPFWGLLMAVAMAAIMVLPIGVIQAISNNQVGLNVITEMICGYVLPGRPIANVYFKCFGYMAMYQCLLLVSDLKLGHYMKIPPRSMFVAQIWGTIVGALINYWVLKLIILTKRPYLDGTLRDPSGQWTGYASQVFNTASIVWGLIGPARTFGNASIYHPLLWGFLIGFFAPLPFYLLHRKFPKARFDLVNVPLICSGLSILPGTYTNFIIMGFIASFLSQYYGLRYKYHWWKKYNYVLSAALDSGAQIVTMVIFFCLNGINKVPFPQWWGNDEKTQGERCFGPD
ncbi:hypothetical protein G9A89_008641 [Geosiphon pyriformis]|nr:hypothetical protein G9A89_008641 [Geosiphon pyriformis]